MFNRDKIYKKNHRIIALIYNIKLGIIYNKVKVKKRIKIKKNPDILIKIPLPTHLK